MNHLSRQFDMFTDFLASFPNYRAVSEQMNDLGFVKIRNGDAHGGSRPLHSGQLTTAP